MHEFLAYCSTFWQKSLVSLKFFVNFHKHPTIDPSNLKFYGGAFISYEDQSDR